MALKGSLKISPSSGETMEEPEGRPGGPGRGKQIRAARPLVVLRCPGPPGIPSRSSLGSLELSGRYFQGDKGKHQKST